MGFVEWYEKTYGAEPNTEPGAWSWDVEVIEEYARSVEPVGLEEFFERNWPLSERALRNSFHMWARAAYLASEERFRSALAEKAQLVREGREQWTKWEVASMLDKFDA
jgi:hypothetical protein